jgi:hypothetical protein
MTTRISQLLGIVGGVKNDTTAQLGALEQVIGTPDLLSGLRKTYKPRAEPRPDQPPALQRPAQEKRVQVTVEEVLDKIAQLFSRQLDLTRTLDEAKTRASADVVVDGRVLLPQVTTDHLVFMEGRLDVLAGIIAKLPVLDPAEDWGEGTEPGQHQTQPAETTSNDSVWFNHTLVEAAVIDGQLVQPQVQVMKRDEVVGFWTTTKYSGAIESRRKREILDRLTRVRQAVTFAREEANMSEAPDVREGAPLFEYLFAG